jgi:RNA polymerase sigma factor (TIGR02999 family)
MSHREDVTDVLLNAQRDPGGLDRIVPIVYDELRRVARAHLSHEAPNHTLEPTALVHEVYLRLVHVDRMTIQNRAHFLALAARLMRQVLVDHARRKRSDKRGGEITILPLEEAETRGGTAPNVDLIALDDALGELASIDPRQRDVVELKFFAGLTIPEIAASLNLSPATVEREWAVAKAWLFRRMARITAEAASRRRPQSR